MTGLTLVPQVFVTTKPGESDATCQDVASVTTSSNAHGGNGHGSATFVVADGATGGWDGRLWAELVVGEVAKRLASFGPAPDRRWVRTDLAEAIEAARETWRAAHANLGDSDDPIAALAHAKYLSTGGLCTLTTGVLGPVGPNDEFVLRAVAVGDSPIFWLRPGPTGMQLQCAAPIERSTDFDSSPHLVSSRQRADLGTVIDGVAPVLLRGIRHGDVVLVTTDAVAQWALMRHERGAPAWDVLASMDSSGFAELLRRIRATREIVADDVLVVRLAVVDSEPRP